ncbi:MAG TPA: hypothetical protein VFJ43_15635, partial [Bacteroidia bacterium]|nr:hypothetical protein [Bacteroidia bacterium]
LPFFAQQNNYGHSFSSSSAKAHAIRSQKTTTFFSVFPSGLSSKRDSLKLDTAVVETQQYDTNGKILKKTYDVKIDKSRYATRSDYFYSSEGHLSYAVTHEGNVTVDSMVMLNQPSPYSSIEFHPDRKLIYERKGDSLLIEKRISGNDTIVHQTKFIENDSRTHWDDEYSGHYAKRIIHSDKIHTVDTCTFYNDKGKIILSIVDHYDNQDHVIVSEYYNYRDKNCSIYSTRYSDKQNMTVYLPANRKGKLTYTIRKTYNAQGLVSEIKHIPVKKRVPITDIKIEYEYY